jgi:hypothetical protein
MKKIEKWVCKLLKRFDKKLGIYWKFMSENKIDNSKECKYFL